VLLGRHLEGLREGAAGAAEAEEVLLGRHLEGLREGAAGAAEAEEVLLGRHLEGLWACVAGAEEAVLLHLLRLLLRSRDCPASMAAVLQSMAVCILLRPRRDCGGLGGRGPSCAFLSRHCWGYGGRGPSCAFPCCASDGRPARLGRGGVACASENAERWSRRHLPLPPCPPSLHVAPVMLR
jgi:hypothetical protein